MFIEEFDEDCQQMVFIAQDKVTLDHSEKQLYYDYETFKELMIHLMEQIATTQNWEWTYKYENDEDETFFSNEEMEVHTSFIINDTEHDLKFTLVEEKYLLD